MAKIAFSVVIPVFNRPEDVKRAISSVLRQTCQSFEIIVVDDGSAVRCDRAVKSFRDTRIRYHWQRNTGVSGARNAGIRLAKGNYIAFLDSDDEFRFDKLEKVARFADATGAEVLTSYIETRRAKGLSTLRPGRPLLDNDDIAEFLFAEGEVLHTSTIVVRADLAKRYPFDESLPVGEDPAFLVVLSQHKARFCFIPEALAVWHDEGIAGRLSNVKAIAGVEAWGERNLKRRNARAYWGYRANVLSFSLMTAKPLTVLADIAYAVVAGHITPVRGIQSFLRGFLPRGLYRSLVDKLLTLRNAAT